MKTIPPLFDLPGLDPVFPRIEQREVLGLAAAAPGYFVLLQDPKPKSAAPCEAQRLPIVAWLLLHSGEMRPLTAGQCEWTEISAILCPDGVVIAGGGMRQ